MWVCVVSAGQGVDRKPNDIRLEAEFAGKTVEELAEGVLKAQYQDGYLSIVTPSFRMRLPLDCRPLEVYPELRLATRPERFPPPPFHLGWFPKADQWDVELPVAIETQLETPFPAMSIPFTFAELEVFSGATVRDRCRDVFAYDVEKCRLLQNGRTIDDVEPAQGFIHPPDSDPLIFACEVSEKEHKAIFHRLFLCNQMVSTEETFLRDLRELTNYWRPAIAKRQIMTDDQFQALFHNIDPILKAHEFFCERLNAQPVSFASQYGCIFLNFVEFFKIGTAFVSKFRVMDAMIKELCKTHGFKNKWLEIERELPSGSGRDFLSFYVTPVQRYPRYPLLLRDLRKGTPDFHPDKPFLAAAINAIDRVNKVIDQSSATEYGNDDIRTVQNLFDRNVQIMVPGRKIVRKADVRLTKPRSTPGIIYLFNDLVLIANSIRTPHQVILRSPILNFRFANSRDSISFVHEGREHVLVFSPAHEKIAWLEPFVGMRQKALDAIRNDGKITLAKWLDVEVGNNIPAVMDVDGCASSGSAWFLSGATSPRADSNVLIRHDFESELWITIDLPNGDLPRNSHTFTLCNGHLYLLFGAARKAKLSDVWRYDPILDTWTKLDLTGDVIHPRKGHSCVCVGTLLYAFGGKAEGGNFLNELVIIDTLKSNVRCLNNMEGAPPARAFHSSVYMPNTNEIAIIGGMTKKGVVGDIYIFKLASETWRIEPHAVIDARMSHRSFFWGQWLITFGGVGGNTGCGRMALIDTAFWNEGLVKECGNIPFEFSHFALAQIDESRLLVFGGLDAANKAPAATSYILDLTGGSVERAKKSIIVATAPVLQPTLINRVVAAHPSADVAQAKLLTDSGRPAEGSQQPQPPAPPAPPEPPESPQPPTPPPQPAKDPEPPSPAAEEPGPPLRPRWRHQSVIVPAPSKGSPCLPAPSVEPPEPLRPSVTFSESPGSLPWSPDRPNAPGQPPNPGGVLPAGAEPVSPQIGPGSGLDQGMPFGADEPSRRFTLRTPPAIVRRQPGIAPWGGLAAQRVRSYVTDRDSLAAARLAAFESDICGQQGVDLKALPPMVQLATRMKVKCLWQVTEENAGLEVAIGSREQRNAQAADGEALVKVVIRGQNRASVVRCPPRANAGDLAALVARVLGRDARLVLRMEQKEVELTEEAISQALKLVASKDMHAIVVLADSNE